MINYWNQNTILHQKAHCVSVFSQITVTQKYIYMHLYSERCGQKSAQKISGKTKNVIQTDPGITA